MTKERGSAIVALLLDFDPAVLGPAELLIGWKAIAEATGFSVDTLQRACGPLEIRLPKWGRGETSPVCLARAKVTILRRIVLSGLGGA